MQVWFKNRKVGDAKVGTPSPGMREIRMATLNLRSLLRPATKPGEMLPEPVANTIRLPLDVRRLVIDELTIFQDGPGVVGKILADQGVRREECEVFVDHNRNAQVYQFKIIRVTLDLLEEIFDYDWFEPADGERDPLFCENLSVADLSALSAKIGPISTGQITLSSGIRLNVRS